MIPEHGKFTHGITGKAFSKTAEERFPFCFHYIFQRILVSNEAMHMPMNESESPDYEEKTWYAGGLAFECTQCGNCCSGPGTGYVWVSEEEVRSLAHSVGLSGDLDMFERKFTRRVGNRTSLVEYSDGDCIFLEAATRDCTVYESRPSQCRTWPFWAENLESPKNWAKAARGCPGCNQGKLYSVAEIQTRLDRDLENQA